MTEKLQMLLTFLLLLLAGCASQTGEEALTDSGLERHLVVYSPHGKEILTEFKEAFEKAHPGIVVDFLYLPSQQCLERIRNEKANPLGDVWWGAGHPTFMTAADEDLLMPYQPTWAGAVAKDQQDAAHRWHATFLSPEIIFYNRDLMTRDKAPRDWEDLADPLRREQILMRLPLPSDTMRAIFFGKIMQSIAITGNEEDAFEWMLCVHKNTREYLASGELLFRKMAQRAAPVSVWTLSDIMLQKSRYQYPFEIVFPESGCPVLYDGIALIKNAPHPKAAQAYLEFVTSASSAIHLANEPYFRIPSRTDLPKESLPEWMRSLSYKPLPLDWKTYQARMNEWMGRWDREIRGKERSDG